MPIPKYPRTGMALCEIPIVMARAREFFSLLSVKISPCENETIRQSIPKAMLKKINSKKCKLLPQITCSKEIYT